MDSFGNAYVTGFTTGGFPTTPGAYQTTFGGGPADTFVAKLNAAGSARIYSTYLGGSAGDYASGIAVHSSGNVYVTGNTYGSFPTTSGASQTTYGGGGIDAFVTELNASGSGLLYSTYLGGGSGDAGYGIAVDPSGDAYVTGVTGGSFPTTTGAYQTTFGGSLQDAFVAKIPTGIAAGCPPHTVHGHISTVPPGHFPASHVHHGQHGHIVTGCSLPHHGPFHLTSETEEQDVPSAGGPAESLEFVAAVNQDSTTGPARHGTLLQLFGSARGLFLGDEHNQPAEGFIPPAFGSPLYYTTGLTEVHIGGMKARVLFSGLAPGLSGVWQVNVVVPPEAPLGRLAVRITYEGNELKAADIVIE